MWNYTLKTDLSPLLKLALPLVLSGIAQSSVYFLQTVFFAHLGQKALAAGALVSWLAGTLIVILFGTLSSINVLIAHKHGAEDSYSIALILRDSILLALLFAIPSFLLFWNSALVFQLLGQDPTVVSLAKPYLHILAWSIFPNLAMIVFLEFLMGLGKARIILFFDLLYVSMAIISNYVFIFGKLGLPALGIAGAGWGMLVSCLITAMAQACYLLSHKNYRIYFKSLFKFTRPSFLWELLYVGVPMGVMYCAEVAFFFALTLFMGNLGAQILAGNQIALQYLGMLMSVVFSIAQAITVRMGHLLGAKNIVAAKKAAYAGFLLSVIFTGVVAICYWFFPKIIIAIDFNVNDPKNDIIIYYTKQFLAISAIFQLLEALRISLFGALRGLKDTHFPLVISIISFWCLALPLGYVSSRYLQMDGQGFWWAMVVGAGCGVLLLYRRFKVKMNTSL